MQVLYQLPYLQPNYGIAYLNPMNCNLYCITRTSLIRCQLRVRSRCLPISLRTLCLISYSVISRRRYQSLLYSNFTADLVYNPCKVYTIPASSFYNFTDTSSTLASLLILPIQLALHDVTSCLDQLMARLVNLLSRGSCPYRSPASGFLLQIKIFTGDTIESRTISPLGISKQASNPSIYFLDLFM